MRLKNSSSTSRIDQYRFNPKAGDAVEEAKEACSSQFFQVSACSMTRRRSRRSRTASNDLSDNCHDKISNSNDLDAVAELKSLLNHEFTSGQPNTPSVRGRLDLSGVMTSG